MLWSRAPCDRHGSSTVGASYAAASMSLGVQMQVWKPSKPSMSSSSPTSRGSDPGSRSRPNCFRADLGRLRPRRHLSRCLTEYRLAGGSGSLATASVGVLGCRAQRVEVPGELAPKRPARLHVERAMDRLVRDLHLRIVGV